MKKILLCTTIALCSALFTQAQEFHYGAKAGVNFASAHGDDAENLETRTSFNLGGVVNYKLDEKLGFQAELLYSGQGYSVNNDDNEVLNPNTQTIILNRGSVVVGTNDDGVRLGYINLPLLVDYTVYDGLSLQAGPEVAFNISSKAETGNSDVDLKDETNGVSLAAIIGAQYKLPMGVFFQARYALGLSDISKNDAFEAKNAVFSISAGYFFN